MWPNANNMIELSCLAGSFSLPPTTDIPGDVGSGADAYICTNRGKASPPFSTDEKGNEAML